MADTIREFLVGLGWQLDESGERRFIAAIEGATLRANLLADAIENMARVVVDKVAQVAENFEQLYYQSQQIGASAQSIKAFEYAVSQLGGTVAGANASLQGFGDFLRNTPGAAGALAKQLGIPLKDTADRGLFLLEVGEKLSKMPAYLANRYRETYHLGDQDTIFAAGRAGARDRFNESLKSQGDAGIDGPAFKNAAKFEQAWREVWQRIGNMAEGGESKLFTALTEPMQKFGKWLDENSPKINEAITNMATAVGSLTIAWVDDLNKVHWNDVATDFEHVTKSIAGFVSELTGLMRWLVDFNERSKDWWITKFFNGLTGGGLGSIHGNPEFEGGGDSAPFTEGGGSGGGIWGRVKRFFGFGGGEGNEKGSPPTGTLATRGLELMNYLVQKRGWTAAAAAIAAGNAQQESGVRSDGPMGDPSTPGGSWGMFQWNRERLAALRAKYGDKWQTKEAQFEFFADEAESKLPQWKKAGDLSGAGYISHAYEGYADDSTGTRVANAEQWLKAYQAGATTAMPSRPVTSSPEIEGHITPFSEFRKKLDSGAYDVTGAGAKWDQGPAWSGLNASLPVGGATTNDNSKAITSSVTNNVTVNAPDPHSAAAMVGLHLDRSANDLARNLQGAHQ